MLKKSSNSLRKALLFLTVLAIVLSTLVVSARSEGEWVSSPSQYNCQQEGYAPGCPEQDQVCADWDVDGDPLLSCCIESQYLGTTHFAACSE